ncbi:hypothetical protein [Tenacibaculum sp.]|uniref:hypothetical protein n=1 Tax=Tenacibaculum sp. TaxID=1906242 RepID=UPI003D10E898
MIETKELRIGNYFIGHDNKVFEWSLFHFALLQNETGITLDEIIKEPISLTEDWLLRFGFERVDTQFYKKEIGGNVFILVNYNKRSTGCFGAVTFETDLKEDSYVGHIKKRCKYIHELQNLYFSLTGEELKELEVKPQTIN